MLLNGKSEILTYVHLKKQLFSETIPYWDLDNYYHLLHTYYVPNIYYTFNSNKSQL